MAPLERRAESGKRRSLTAACLAMVLLVFFGRPAPHGGLALEVEPDRQAPSDDSGGGSNDLGGETPKDASQPLPPEPVEAPVEEPVEEPAGVGSQAAPAVSGPRDLFDLQGIDQSHFDLLSDGTPWQEGENETLLKIIYRLNRSFPLMYVEAWCLGNPEPAGLAEDPHAYRGEIFQISGRVTSVELRRPAPEERERFELDEYYRLGFLLADDEQPAVVFANTIPEAWKPGEPIDARAGALAVFLKLASGDAEAPLPVFAASRVAWYPPTRLGNLGFDVGLLDDLPPRSRLTGRNRECFYQMLAAVGRSKPGELLAEAANQLRKTGKDRLPVVPLFNQPLSQQGRLVVLSGSAREVTLVRVGDEDIVSRFGIDHYYQVFLFTEDSQSNPLVFCVRELPEGMPVGEEAQYGEYVTVAGFFFNTWAYRNRRAGAASTPREEWQLAPLLIGRDLKWHPRKKPARSAYLGAIAGGLFVLALLGVWLALWRYSRGDKRFHRETIARQLGPDSGVSLDRVGLNADGTPDFSGLDQAADSGSNAAEQPPNEKEVS